jgi:hypothetical protein
MARLRAARTIYSGHGAIARARDRCVLSLVLREAVETDAVRCLGRLPPALVARLMELHPELVPPELVPPELVQPALVCSRRWGRVGSR